MAQEALPAVLLNIKAIWSAARFTAPGGPKRLRTSAKPSFMAVRRSDHGASSGQLLQPDPE